MNKAQFLHELQAILAGKVPPDELNDVISYYEAYFEDSEEDEETVAERLGSPASVAEQVLKDTAERPRVSTPPPTAGRRRRAAPLIIAVVVGIILVIFALPSALLLALRTDNSRTPTVSESNTPVLISEDSDLSVMLSPFDTLDLNVDVAEVWVTEGDDWHLRMVNEFLDSQENSPYHLHYSQSDGTLSIWSTQDRTNQQPDRGSFDIRVELTVPSGAVLEQAKLSLGVGSLDWEDCAVSGLLQVKNGVGELNVSAQAGEAELSTGVGNVALELTGSQSDYSWHLSTGTGDIRLNGEMAKPFTYTVTGGQGERTLSLTSGTGDVSLDFQ